MSRSISWCVAGSYGNGDRRPLGLCVSGRTLLLNYTIQPVVKPDWQPVVSCIQTFNRTGSAGCQTRFKNRVERTVYSFDTIVKPVLHPALTTGCIHDTADCQAGMTTGCIVYTGYYARREAVSLLLLTGRFRRAWWRSRWTRSAERWRVLDPLTGTLLQGQFPISHCSHPAISVACLPSCKTLLCSFAVLSPHVANDCSFLDGFLRVWFNCCAVETGINGCRYL